MVTALIFAGGIGERMSPSAKPKQFLEIHGKPILVYTIEHFEEHPEVDNIVVVCVEGWMDDLRRLLDRFFVKKVNWVVPGGETGHESIYNGLNAICSTCQPDDIVLIHDGVRPLISEDIITKNIAVAKEKGNAVTVTNVSESVAMLNERQQVENIPNKFDLRVIQAPQTFRFQLVWDAHQQALQDGYLSIDSAGLLHHYGHELHTVEGPPYNLKITTPSDYYIFRAIHDAIENLQIFGI